MVTAWGAVGKVRRRGGGGGIAMSIASVVARQ
jgi:hypothetical protein